MIEPTILEAIRAITHELVQKMGIEGSLSVQEGADGSVCVDLTLQEPQIFIGERGQTMQEIQHLLKAMVRKKVADSVYIVFDINDYRKNKEHYLKELARNIADEVVLLRKDKELPAMTAAERRVVHMELGQRTDVVAESMGEEPERRIVIRPTDSRQAPETKSDLDL